MEGISITELEYLKLYIEDKQTELNKLRMCDLSVIYRLISKEIYKENGCKFCNGGTEHIRLSKDNEVCVEFTDGDYGVVKTKYCPNCGKELKGVDS